ncbi:hypothetical protein PR048_009032 [Dryococelus australis]|uniref:YqaJ viral recombinase domain-containing protein n=1 Tax=Dryococelus australis TaxID=614101 RepID=A0ABQ9HYS1_9NEOP|nr:hypothetical protein PR048_009032 [Dryococelus australis]
MYHGDHCLQLGVVCKRRTATASLVKKILYVQPPPSAVIQHGIANEEVTLKEYETTHEVRVSKCGLFVGLKRGWLAGSPDGLVGVDEIVQVKCPFKARDLTPSRVAKNLKNS